MTLSEELSEYSRPRSIPAQKSDMVRWSNAALSLEMERTRYRAALERIRSAETTFSQAIARIALDGS